MESSEILRQQVLISAYVSAPLPLFPNILVVSSDDTCLPELNQLTNHLMFDRVAYWASSAVPITPDNVTLYVEDLTKKKNPYKKVQYDVVSLNKPIDLRVLPQLITQLSANGWLAPTVLISAVIEAPSAEAMAHILNIPFHSVRESTHVYSAIRTVLTSTPNTRILEAPNIEEVSPTTYHTVTLLQRNI